MSSFISSLYYGKVMVLYGRKRILLIGLIVMGISLIIFGLIDYIHDNNALLISIAIITRLLMGFSYAAY